MGTFLNTRRYHIARRGRPMTLRRPLTTTTVSDVTVAGIDRAYKPEQVAGDIRQGDRMVAILNDEITAAGWPGPPRPRDLMLIDGLQATVEGSFAIYDGAVCIGHDIQVRGGR